MVERFTINDSKTLLNFMVIKSNIVFLSISAVVNCRRCLDFFFFEKASVSVSNHCDKCLREGLGRKIYFGTGFGSWSVESNAAVLW